MPTLERFTPFVLGPKPWGEELLVAHTPAYTGKILRMKAGHRGGLQWHRLKDETFHLVSGIAHVRYDSGDGGLLTITMEPGQSYHVPPGAVHQVEAVTDCVFFEASTPVFDDRVNVGAIYGLTTEAEAW